MPLITTGERNMTIKIKLLDGSIEEFESLEEIDSSWADLWGAIIIQDDISKHDTNIQNEKGAEK